MTRLTINHNGQSLILPDIFARILHYRGMKDNQAIGKFLYPSLADLPHPDKMKNLSEAAELVYQYIQADKPVLIWGDYDVDGTTGTALLVNFLRLLGCRVSYHIPNRLTEGYGLHEEWFTDRVDKLPKRGFLVITVDCGISNYREIERIMELGGDVIVTDHHSIPEGTLPRCLVINPSQHDCGFHAEKLSGVGVAFYLAAALRSVIISHRQELNHNCSITLKPFLAFVALGTIADMVDLTPTNRILVRAGLEALQKCSDFPGLAELLQSSELHRGDITSEDINFQLAPKINAAGRLGKSRVVVDLLTSADKKEVKELAASLVHLNTRRKQISAQDTEKALEQCHNDTARSTRANKVIIVHGDFHLGVAGIVAAKLVEQFDVPALVFGEKTLAGDKPAYSGSARSVEGINITQMISHCSSHVEHFGGHAMAAGITVLAENFDAFCHSLQDEIERQSAEKTAPAIREQKIECAVEQLMSENYLAWFKLLEPFGPGNEQPVFVDSKAQFVDSRTVGQGAEHLQVTLRGKLSNLKGIGFFLGHRIDDVQKNPMRTLSYTPTINRFRNTISYQVRIVDL